MTGTADSEATSASQPDGSIPATVVAVLPNEMFRLRLHDGSERLAHVAGNLRKGFTRLLPGDAVRIELSPFDPQKARILERVTASRR